MKLWQIVLDIEKEALPRLRIKTPDAEFSFDSEEYNRRCGEEFEEHEIMEDYANRNLLLRVFKEERGDDKTEPFPPFKPDDPLYPGIGI